MLATGASFSRRHISLVGDTHIFSLIPPLTSHRFTGKEVMDPQIMAIGDLAPLAAAAASSWAKAVAMEAASTLRDRRGN